MKKQRGVALSGLLFWSIVLVLVAVLGIKVAPTYIEYAKTLKDTKAVVAQVAPDASVTDVRKAFDKYAEIDHLAIPSSQLEIFKDSGKIVIEFAYEKRIPLFANVSLLIDYKGTTAGN
ncbi:DUF4845 domain-containing protein [Dechloromonas denitrificans]|uniref:DUF4845 domain-containing protein n=1 Tax=Dechloromonas denitrificans TaxID=281362 RepID=UPI001CF8058D|nr:DUF4845 domain-containing protein [Dechloromonas denitrificans]UCV13119.1 DUF4845 domain-containing protein [Dechloromonas denitrificans]